jgi:hypothetical protein
MPNWKHYKTFDNYVTAQIELNELLQVDIECKLINENTITIFPALGNAIGGIQLLINANDEAKLLAYLTAKKEEGIGVIVCPKCNGDQITKITTPTILNYLNAIITFFLSKYAIAEEMYRCKTCNHKFKENV